MSNTVTYSASRTINIGNYENMKELISFTVDINNTSVSTTGTITETQKASVPDLKDFRIVANKVIKSVSKVLDKRETILRNWSSQFTELEFDTLEKLPSNRHF